MPSRRQRRRVAAQHRRPAPTKPAAADELELAERGERLAYTREQAAEAIGVSLTTLDRRVVPAIATGRTEWGARLIPVSELERYLAERTQQPRAERRPPRGPGRKRQMPDELIARIRDEHARGRSLGEIARGLDADRVKTAQGGRQWWPSTVRAALDRSRPLASARAADEGE